MIVLPYHNPIVLAKAVATLDVMSGGRVTLTFGVGHAEHEFEILGVPFHRRGQITDEYVKAMQELWTADEPSFQGEFVSFKGLQFEPKPRQKPHPPLWFGGNSHTAMRRVAHDGTGWMPWLITPDELPDRLGLLHQLPGYGKNGEVDIWFPPSPIRIREDNHELTADKPQDSFSSPQEVIDAIGRLRDMGVTWTGIPYPRPRSDQSHRAPRTPPVGRRDSTASVPVTEQLYHGTRADLKPGDLIAPGYRSNFGTGRSRLRLSDQESRCGCVGSRAGGRRRSRQDLHGRADRPDRGRPQSDQGRGEPDGVVPLAGAPSRHGRVHGLATAPSCAGQGHERQD